MSTKALWKEMPKRTKSFVVGQTIYWFDGLSNIHNPHLVEYQVVCVCMDIQLGINVVTATERLHPIEGEGPLTSWPFNDCEVDLVNINWKHAVYGETTKVFAFTNPFFLSEDEKVWLIEAGKSEDPFLPVQFLSNVRFVMNADGVRKYSLALINWTRFWKSYREPTA